MSKNVKWICGVLVLVLVIVGAFFLYNYISGKNAPDNVADKPANSTEQNEATGNEQKTDETAKEDANSTENGAEEAPEEETVYGARSFVVLDKNGKEAGLEDMRGKPVVINFWASTTSACKEELDVFEKMYKECGNDVAFMMINMTDNQRETLDSAKKFIKDNGYTFPVYFDTELSAATTYNVSGLPATFFIDAEGNFVTYAQGAIDYETLGRGIDMIK